MAKSQSLLNVLNLVDESVQEYYEGNLERYKKL